MDIAERIEQLGWQAVDAERRLKRLERQNRLLKITVVLALALAGGSAFLLWPAAIGKFAEATVLVLGPDGREHELILTPLETGGGATTLRLRDASRRHAIDLTQAQQGPRLAVTELSANPRQAELSLGPTGPAFVLSDPRNGWQVEATAEPAGPALVLADRAENLWRRRAVLGLSEKGPFLRFLDAKGKVTSEWPSDPSSAKPAVATATAPAIAGDTLQARAIRLVDDKGLTRAELALVANEPVLTFKRTTGKRIGQLGLIDGSPGLRWFDENDQPRIELCLNRDSFGAQLCLLDEQKRPRTRLGIDSEGASTMLNFWDQEGRLRTGVGVEHEGSIVGLSGLDGKPRAVLGVLGYQPSLDFYNKEQRRQVSMRIDDDSSNVSLADPDGRPRLVLSVAADGAASTLTALTPEPKVRAILGTSGLNPVFSLIHDNVPPPKAKP